jgi:hypothetical protein
LIYATFFPNQVIGRDFHTEAGKALDIIQASIGNDGLTRIEPFSTIEIEFTSNDAEE